MIGAMFGVFFLMMALGVPIAFALGLASMFYLIFSDIPLALLGQRMYAGMYSFPLLSIPAFIVAGSLFNSGGIAKRLFAFCNSLVGQIRGSLSLINVLTSKVFAGITGTAVADVCNLGTILIPAMKREGYEEEYAVALTASTAIIAPTMPPSVPMVIAGTAVGISIGRMFAGGIIPGLMIGFSFLGLVYVIAIKRNYPRRRRYTIREKLLATKDALGALLAPAVLLFGVMGGFFTPTEAAIVTVLYALIAGALLYRELKFMDIYRNIAKTMRTAATVLVLMGLANVFGSILIMEQVPQTVARFILGISDNRIVIILVLNLFLLFVGLFMDAMAAIMITFPFLMPVAVQAGMDPIHFAVMACINLFIGLITPPFGLCIATAAQIGKVPLWPSLKAAFPFVIMLICILMVVAFVPQTVLWLPNLLFN